MLFGSIQYREEQDRAIRCWLKERVRIINNIPDNIFQGICYFSILEKFAQEYSNYRISDSKNAFCKFVLEFQQSYDFLGEFDPVSLYYYYEKELKDTFDLSFLDYGRNDNPTLAVQFGKANDMVKRLKDLNIDGKKVERHIFVSLLYSLRSSLSHECSSHNDMMQTNLHPYKEYPHYLNCSYSIISDNTIDRFMKYILVFPVGFIEKLTIECIDNYLKYSLEHKNHPFENDNLSRKAYFAWYE